MWFHVVLWEKWGFQFTQHYKNGVHPPFTLSTVCCQIFIAIFLAGILASWWERGLHTEMTCLIFTTTIQKSNCGHRDVRLKRGPLICAVIRQWCDLSAAFACCGYQLAFVNKLWKNELIWNQIWRSASLFC